ncbi:GNAT family N-acetyltransferase [Vibrio antiquarius]|uniref:GNAT family N-acetyltransferase n=1 Tax=Vibrio antiquarius (strain Ex25) TaxID=150340 RepID=UPI00265A9989|nr:GNAT family N-acetyltransferase [Vibrio antiquarius]MCR9581207.1 GNAT family N-acetyltransferase [Vibrio antiquarius]MCR9616339.1 GNAT family N-acetyltransferase [Vibrio antiquarius]
MKVNLKAKTIGLRLVTLGDSEFIHNLRVDARYNQYLSPVNGGLAQQEEWLTKYKEKEKKQEEFYFIIYRLDTNLSIGTVRLYDFINKKMSFCWGSWILNDKKTRYAALESALLVYEFAFKKLGFQQSHFDVRKENNKVVEFHEKFGAQKIDEDDLDFFYIYTKSDYINYSKKFERFLNK